MKKSLPLLLFLSTSVFATTYVVRHGDNLSSILHRLKKFPLYGQNGSVQKVASRNKIQDIEMIYEGQKLEIDFENEIESKNSDKITEAASIEEFKFQPEIREEVKALPVQKTYKMELELGEMAYVSKSPTGNLNLYGGSTRVSVEMESGQGIQSQKISLSADMIKLSNDIDFAITPKSLVLLQAEILTGVKSCSYEAYIGLGLKDVMGVRNATPNAEGQNLLIVHSRSPYLAISIGKDLLGIDFKVDGQYILASKRGKFEVKSGTFGSLEASKNIFKNKDYVIDAFIKHQIQSTKTGFTEDKDTRNLLGVEIEF